MSRRPRRRLLFTALAALVVSSAVSSCRPGFLDPEPADPPGPRSFTVLASGDILVYASMTAEAAAEARRTGAGGRDFRSMFTQVKPLIEQADLAICHLEVPIAGQGERLRAYPLFNAPPEIVDAAADAGYDTCSTASNHTLDRGARGVRNTLDALDRAGIRHTGSYRSEAEARRPNILDVKGVKVAHLSYTYGYNGMPKPAGQPWIAGDLDGDRIIADARAARAAGAQVVIVSNHWGAEYRHRPTPAQLAVGRRLMADPAIDLVVGHHAHVVQPFERIGDKWIAYGLGNQIADQFALGRTATQENVYGRFQFTEVAPDRWRVTEAGYVPCLITKRPFRLVPLERTLAGGGLSSAQRARYTKALARIKQVVATRGATGDGLTLAR
jgi:poly-gamma-glutamate capsule biosynthesis protein CapA/YwtB (metallophosphatase superfamily)